MFRILYYHLAKRGTGGVSAHHKSRTAAVGQYSALILITTSHSQAQRKDMARSSRRIV